MGARGPLKGSKFGKTIARELLVSALKNTPEAKQIIEEIVASRVKKAAADRKKAVDVMAEFLPAVAALAGKYQNMLVRMLQTNQAPEGMTPEELERRFVRYVEVLGIFGSRIAPYESPTFKAVTLQMETDPSAAPSADRDAKQIELIAERDPAAACAAYDALIRKPRQLALPSKPDAAA